MKIDMDRLSAWQGREQSAQDSVALRLVENFLATFDAPTKAIAHGDGAPAGVHWCLAPPSAPMAEIGPDGHGARGHFLPPVPLPRRMWAGGRLWLAQELHVGDVAYRRSRVEKVTLKEGSAGPLLFVLVSHEITTDRGLILREEQDIVYRDFDAAPSSAKRENLSASQRHADVRETINPSSVLLFRYSALTFNGHRIHYDRRYASEVEGYPGLVVHGPLLATLLWRLGERLKGAPLATFSFKATRPLYDEAPFAIAGAKSADGMDLWVENAEGQQTMQASAS